MASLLSTPTDMRTLTAPGRKEEVASKALYLSAVRSLVVNRLHHHPLQLSTHLPKFSSHFSSIPRQARRKPAASQRQASGKPRQIPGSQLRTQALSRCDRPVDLADQRVLWLIQAGRKKRLSLRFQTATRAPHGIHRSGARPLDACRFSARANGRGLLSSREPKGTRRLGAERLQKRPTVAVLENGIRRKLRLGRRRDVWVQILICRGQRRRRDVATSLAAARWVGGGCRCGRRGRRECRFLRGHCGLFAVLCRRYRVSQVPKLGSDVAQRAAVAIEKEALLSCALLPIAERALSWSPPPAALWTSLPSLPRPPPEPRRAAPQAWPSPCGGPLLASSASSHDTPCTRSRASGACLPNLSFAARPAPPASLPRSRASSQPLSPPWPLLGRDAEEAPDPTPSRPCPGWRNLLRSSRLELASPPRPGTFAAWPRASRIPRRPSAGPPHDGPLVLASPPLVSACTPPLSCEAPRATQPPAHSAIPPSAAAAYATPPRRRFVRAEPGSGCSMQPSASERPLPPSAQRGPLRLSLASGKLRCHREAAQLLVLGSVALPSFRCRPSQSHPHTGRQPRGLRLHGAELLPEIPGGLLPCPPSPSRAVAPPLSQAPRGARHRPRGPAPQGPAGCGPLAAGLPRHSRAPARDSPRSAGCTGSTHPGLLS
eukprot:scaffold8121_cov258-Pinguiococcus_pyrenoidosus.AAC.2